MNRTVVFTSLFFFSILFSDEPAPLVLEGNGNVVESELVKNDTKQTVEVCIPPCPIALCCEYPRIYHLYADYVFGRGLGFNQGYSTLGFFTAPRFSGNWLPFIDVKGHMFNDGKWAANGGLGVRYLIENLNVFFGMNGFYDYRRYKKTNFNEVGVGIEFLGNWVAFRANGYVPIGKDQKLIGYTFNKFQGNQLLLNESAYLSMWGVDGEFEARVFSFKGAEFQAAAGPYYYKTNDTFSKDMVGGRIRASFDYRNTLYASATTTFDRIFNWRWQGEVGLTFAFWPRVHKCGSFTGRINAFCSNESVFGLVDFKT